MSATVFLAVLFAAVLHAVWNALLKHGADKFVGMAGVVIGHTPFALAVLPFVPFPATEAYPFMVGSVLLHFCYQMFLLWSYRIGDLTQVYPIARGTAPLIVAGVSIVALGVNLLPQEIVGIFVIGAGLISLSLVRQSSGARNAKAAILALITGCFIAAYSLNDGLGARAAETALGFYAWSTLGSAIIFSITMIGWKPGVLRQMTFTRPGLRAFFIGGGASFTAYAMVTWAFTQAPIALVTALRETSIVFALLIGVFFLRERLDLTKVLSTFLT
ncbi:MAG: DMT family transporter, partial [Pseudomonadota bacterium]